MIPDVTKSSTIVIKAYQDNDEQNESTVSTRKLIYFYIFVEYLNAQCVTNNNFGWYYQKQNDFKNGLKYLQIALSFNQRIQNDEINQSSTHLNICALYSQIGDHDKAYQHSKLALKLLPSAHRRIKQQMADCEMSDNNPTLISELEGKLWIIT